MKKKRIAVRITWTGIVLLILPIVFTLVVSVIGSLREGQFRFDYRLTAELGFVVVMGLVAVGYGAYVLRERFKCILMTSGFAFLFLIVLLAYPSIFNSEGFTLQDPESIMQFIAVILYNVSYIVSAMIAMGVLHKTKTEDY